MIDQEVESRVAAYQGNPQALQQKYATSQQLIDLLALQKIKSAKEAAAREMQMQLAQQQAANGEANSTVAQQREKEVMDMTKNELASQRGELMQQQQVEQKQAMQKLMGGIASAEGAASAMQPQAMAAGGIVAFKEGDGVKDERYKRKEGESLSDFNNRILQLELQDKKAGMSYEKARALMLCRTLVDDNGDLILQDSDVEAVLDMDGRVTSAAYVVALEHNGYDEDDIGDLVKNSSEAVG
jgi:hypothetical protein